MIKAFKNKLNSKKGETLVESLAGLIVILLAVLIIAGAVVSAAKVNKAVKDKDTNFAAGGVVVPAGAGDEHDVIEIRHITTGAGNSKIYADELTAIVTEYKTDNGYYYYTAK